VLPSTAPSDLSPDGIFIQCDRRTSTISHYRSTKPTQTYSKV
jgi:hypothetical protein